MFGHHINLLNKATQGILPINEFKRLLPGYPNRPFNIARKGVTELRPHKADILLVPIERIHATPTLENHRESPRAGVRLETATDELVLHEPRLSDKAVAEVLRVLRAALGDVAHLGHHLLHVGQLLFIGTVQPESVLPLVVLPPVVEKHQNPAALVLRRNVVTHVGKPVVRKQPVPALLLQSPKRLTENHERLQCVCSELVVKNHSFVFADVCEVYVSNDLKWNGADHLFGDHLNWGSVLLNVCDHCLVVVDVVDIDDLGV